jgi:hypothetical protein
MRSLSVSPTFHAAARCHPYVRRPDRREAVSQAVGHFRRACSVAVQALIDMSQDVNSPTSARVSAARTVLGSALKGVEPEDLPVRVEGPGMPVTRV